MMIDRRDLLGRAALSLAVGAAASLTPSISLALSEEEATAYVKSTVEEVASLVDSAGDAASKAPKLREIMQRRAAMPQIARFAAGVSWRSMSEDQQRRFTDAFAKFISGIYANQFQEYSGQTKASELFQMGRVIDAGRKGMLVQSTIVRTGAAPVVVEWLVTDRPGRIVVADIVIEGVSMLITEREEIGSMLEARGGDVEKLISDLAA